MERLGRTYPMPAGLFLDIPPEDIRTHKLLTETIVDHFEFRQASLDAVVQELRRHIPRVHGKPALRIVNEVPPQRQGPTLTFNLRNVPLIDLIDYAAEVAGCFYAISGDTVVIRESLRPAAPIRPEAVVGPLEHDS